MSLDNDLRDSCLQHRRGAAAAEGVARVAAGLSGWEDRADKSAFVFDEVSLSHRFHTGPIAQSYDEERVKWATGDT